MDSPDSALAHKLRSFSDRSRQILQRLERTEEALRQDEEQLREPGSATEHELRSAALFSAGPVTVLGPVAEQGPGVWVSPIERARGEELVNLVDKLGRCSQQNERLEGQLREWEKEGGQMGQEIAGLRHMVESERRAHGQLEQRLSERDHQTEVLHAKHTELLERAVELEEERDAAREEASQAQAKLAGLEQRTKKLHGRVADTEDHRTLVEANLREKDCEVKNLWSKNSRLIRERDELAKSKEQQGKEIAELRHRLEVLRRKNEGLEKKLGAATNGQAAQSGKVERLEGQLIELAMAMGEQEEQLELRKGGEQHQRLTERQLRVGLAQAQQELGQLSEQLAATAAHRNQLLGEAQKAQSLLDGANIRNSELLRKLQVQGQQRMGEVEETRQLVQAMTGEIEALKRERAAEIEPRARRPKQQPADPPLQLNYEPRARRPKQQPRQRSASPNPISTKPPTARAGTTRQRPRAASSGPSRELSRAQFVQMFDKPRQSPEELKLSKLLAEREQGHGPATEASQKWADTARVQLHRSPSPLSSLSPSPKAERPEHRSGSPKEAPAWAARSGSPKTKGPESPNQSARVKSPEQARPAWVGPLDDEDELRDVSPKPQLETMRLKRKVWPGPGRERGWTQDEKLRNSRLMAELQASLNPPDRPAKQPAKSKPANQTQASPSRSLWSSRASSSPGGASRGAGGELDPRARAVELATNAAKRWAATTDLKLKRRAQRAQ